MSAAEVLTALAAAGAELVAEPAGLRVRAPGRLPGALLAAARDVKPALLRVASGRWRLDLAGWPGWRRADHRGSIREQACACARLWPDPYRLECPPSARPGRPVDGSRCRPLSPLVGLWKALEAVAPWAALSC